MIRKRPTRGLLVADVLGNTVDTITPLYTTIYNYSPRGVTFQPDLVLTLLVHRRRDKGSPPTWPGGPRGRCAGGSSW